MKNLSYFYIIFLLFPIFAACNDNETAAELYNAQENALSWNEQNNPIEANQSDVQLTRICEALIGNNLWGYELADEKIDAGKQLCISELNALPFCKDEYVDYLDAIANMSSDSFNAYSADLTYLSLGASFDSQDKVINFQTEFYNRYPWYKIYYNCKNALSESDLASLESYYDDYNKKYESL